MGGCLSYGEREEAAGRSNLQGRVMPVGHSGERLWAPEKQPGSYSVLSERASFRLDTCRICDAHREPRSAYKASLLLPPLTFSGNPQLGMLVVLPAT